MKITSICATTKNTDYGLLNLTNTAYETLKELGVEVNEINLNNIKLEYYNETCSKELVEIMGHLENSDGIIFAYTSELFAPCALFKVFLEYFSQKEFNKILKNKNCFLLTVSDKFGERSSLDYLSKVLNSFNAFDTLKIGLNTISISQNDIKDIIEKSMEDFYRLLRQNRKFIIPTDCNDNSNKIPDILKAETLPFKKTKISTAEISKKLNLDSFTQKQEEDIDEIVKLFSEKYKKDSNEIISEPNNLNTFNDNIVARAKTAKQLTQSLQHNFKPQLSNGLVATIQLSITGDEPFEGFLFINNDVCEFFDGNSENPDIVVIAQSKIWSDILKGNLTSQKSFMTGQLKVRGNFVLLTKFDQLFNPVN